MFDFLSRERGCNPYRSLAFRVVTASGRSLARNTAFHARVHVLSSHLLGWRCFGEGVRRPVPLDRGNTCPGSSGLPQHSSVSNFDFCSPLVVVFLPHHGVSDISGRRLWAP